MNPITSWEMHQSATPAFIRKGWGCKKHPLVCFALQHQERNNKHLSRALSRSVHTALSESCFTAWQMSRVGGCSGTLPASLQRVGDGESLVMQFTLECILYCYLNPTSYSLNCQSDLPCSFFNTTLVPPVQQMTLFTRFRSNRTNKRAVAHPLHR